MTTNQAIDKFNVLQDRRGAPDLEVDEVLQFLNQAQLEVLNRMFPDSAGGVVNFEIDENTLMNLQPLIVRVDVNTTSPAGDSCIVSLSDLNTALTSASGRTLFRVLNLGAFISSTPFIVKPIKFVKNNNINQYFNNAFKKPSSDRFLYTFTESQFIIYPVPLSFVRFTTVVNPTIMTIDNSPDWDDYMMNQVIAVALEYAQISTRDSELLGSIQNANISK